MGFKTHIIRLSVTLLLASNLVSEAAETPETILIRQTLSADFPATDAVMQSLSYPLMTNTLQHIAATTTRPRAWQIRFESRPSLRSARTRPPSPSLRYGANRAQNSGSWGRATATTIDSDRLSIAKAATSKRCRRAVLDAFKARGRWLIHLLSPTGGESSTLDNDKHRSSSATRARGNGERRRPKRFALSIQSILAMTAWTH